MQFYTYLLPISQFMVGLASASTPAPSDSAPDPGMIFGSVVGGLVFFICVGCAILQVCDSDNYTRNYRPQPDY